VKKNKEEAIPLFEDSAETGQLPPKEEFMAISSAVRQLDPNDPYLEEKRVKINKSVIITSWLIH